MQKGIDNAIAVYKALGAEVKGIHLSSLHDYAAAGSSSPRGRAAAYEQMMLDAPMNFGQRYRDRLVLGSFCTSMDYVQAVRRGANSGGNPPRWPMWMSCSPPEIRMRRR